MLRIFLFLLAAVESNALPAVPTDHSSELAVGRQSSVPLNAALVGLFSPPFVVFVGMSALFYTFEKFTKDMVKAASDKTKIRLRRRKKKPVQAQAPASAAPARDFVREHRKLASALEKTKY